MERIYTGAPVPGCQGFMQLPNGMVCLVVKIRIDPTREAWLQVPHGLSSLGVGDVEMGSL